MSRYDDYINTAALDLPIGRSIKTVCPVCDGGQSREAECSITRYPDGFGWLCFRASCGAKGRVQSPGAAYPVPTPPQPDFTPRPYTGAFTRPKLDTFAYDELDRISALYSDPAASVWGVDKDTIYFRLRNFHLRFIGGFTRSRDKTIRTYRERPGPMYGYYPAYASQGGTIIWIVEDCLSAIRVADQGEHDAMALLNTHLHDQVRREMIALYGKTALYVVALDPGAETAAAKIVDGLRTLDGVNAIQAILPKDIHRMSTAEFRAIVDHYCGRESHDVMEYT